MEIRTRLESSREWIRRRGESGSTIHRVPPEIVSCNQNAYEHFYRPKVVCIGPYFYSSRDEKGLKSMQDHKWVCMLKLTSEENLVDRCLQRMMVLEGRVRESYSEDISWLNSEDLALMLTLDGCFILHLLLKDSVNSGQRRQEFHEDDRRKDIGRVWIWELVKYDLLLLENQIPFFVIQELYEILKARDHDGINLVECVFRYFKNLDPWKKNQPPALVSALPADNVHHLLHLTYKLFLPRPLSDNFSGPNSPQRIPSATELPAARVPRPHLVNFSEPKSSQWIPSATELLIAGVTFKKRKKVSSFLHIKFSKSGFLDSNGVMEIPCLEVHDYSESLFRNLIAFEQSYPDNDFLVTAYATFMNCLVDTQDDLTLLRLNGILAFKMTGDKDTVHLFSRLSNDVHCPADRNYLDGVFKNVTAFKDSYLPRRRIRFANYMRTIFSVHNEHLILFLTLLQVYLALLATTN